MIFNNFTKWTPFASYYFSATNYLVMARINKKSGMISFKTQRIAGSTNAPVKPEISVDDMFKQLILSGDK